MNSNHPKIHINPEGPANKASTFDPSTHLGVLGRFFGGVENAPTSISGGLVFLLIIIGAFNVVWRPEIAMEYWKIIVLPTVSTLLGYLFGKRQKL